MDKFILRVSLLRIVNNIEKIELSKEQREVAIQKYQNNYDKFWCDATFDEVGYQIVDNFDLLWYCAETDEEFINIAIDTRDIPNIAVSIKQMLASQKLNPILEALLCREYMQLNGITQKQLATSLGKTQGAISNKLRLLNLPVQIQNAIYNNKIKERHGRAILKLEKQPKFYEKAMVVYAKVIEQHLSVVQTDDMVDIILGKEVGVKDSLNIKRVRSRKDYKKPEAAVMVEEINKQLKNAVTNIHNIFPRLKIELQQGTDRKDYVFLLKLKGVNDNGENNRNN